RIRGRAIWLHLAGGLDHWARAGEKASGADWKRLLDLAREVDPDPWRCALRAARAGGKKEDLTKLLKPATIPELSVASLRYLARLHPNELGDTAATVIPVLREGQRRYPADFWINHGLAFFLQWG